MRIIKSSPITLIIYLIIVAFYCYYYCTLRPITDPDSYYHAAAAKITALTGHFNPADSMPLTIFKRYPNDQHFGYHWLQSWFATDLNLLKYFQSFLCFISIAIFLFVSKEVDPKLFLWACTLLVSSFGFINRITIIKASALSVSFFMLLIYGFIHSNPISILFTSTAFAICHSGFLICIFVICAYLFGNYKDINSYKNIITCFCGMALGIFLHPDNLEYLKFLYFQGIELAFLKSYSNQITIGQEWDPPKLKSILISNLPILIALIPALLKATRDFKNISNRDLFLFFNLIIVSLLYFRSERFVEYFIPAALLFSLTYINKISILASLIFALAWQPIATNAQLDKQQKNLPNDLLQWLESNYKAEKTICNLDWSNYPELLYHFPNNKYLYGSDPRYLAFENQELYKITTNLINSPTLDLAEEMKQKAKCDLIITNRELSGDFLKETKTFADYYALVLNN